MKCLSIVYPSGTKIADGEKTIEVRSWLPTMDLNEDLLIVENHKYLRNEGDTDLGRPVAIVKIKNTREFIESDITSACASRWEQGYYSWELDNVRPVKSSLSIIAARGIYEAEFPEVETLDVIDKAVAYITRIKNGEYELLVFDHDKVFSDAGTQVIAGTVEDSEGPKGTVIRECFEEGGLSNLKIKSKIDEYTFFRDIHKKYNRRHVFHLESSTDLPNKWTHKIQSNGEDDGHNFHYFWIKLSEAKGLLSGQLDHSIESLQKYLNSKKSVGINQ